MPRAESTLTPATDAGLSSDERGWLRGQTESLRAIARRTASDLLAIGGILRAVRDRLPGHWQNWVEAETAFSPRTAGRFVQAHEAFGLLDQPIAERFDASALYVLSLPTTPPSLREHAVERAAGGEQITHALARDLLDRRRPSTDLTPEELRAFERSRDEPSRPPPGGAAPDNSGVSPEALACALEELCRVASSVYLSILTDDDTRDVTHSVVVVMATGSRRQAVSDDVREAVVQAAGQEPSRECATCGVVKPLYSGFWRAKGKRGGRMPTCRDCEKVRGQQYRSPAMAN